VAFFFQAEDGIRDRTVTGVQTCALPILLANILVIDEAGEEVGDVASPEIDARVKPSLRQHRRHVRCGVDVGSAWLRTCGKGRKQIGRASCRERVESARGAWAGGRKGTDA